MNESPLPALAIDPGRSKWGLAVVFSTGECPLREIVTAEAAPHRIREILGQFAMDRVLLGDRTGARKAKERLEAAVSLPITLVPEHMTTLRARGLYWRDHPIRGWRRLLPQGLLVPPVPLD